MDTFNLTEKQIIKWGGEQLYREAEKQYYLKGDVVNATFRNAVGEADIRHAGTQLHTKFKVSASGLVESMCPCVVNRVHGRICVHVIAAAIMLNRKAVASMKIPEKEREREHAERVANAASGGNFVERDDKAGQPAEIRVRVSERWVAEFVDGRIPVQCIANIAGGGSALSLEYVAQRHIPLKLSRADDTILFVLEDISEGNWTNPLEMTKTDFLSLIDTLVAKERPLYRSGGNPIRMEKTPLESRLMLDMDRDTGELLLLLVTEIPGAGEGAVPDYIVFGNKGWALYGGVLWPLASVLPGPYQKVYLETVAIPRRDTIRFLKNELDTLRRFMSVDCEIDTDLITQRATVPTYSLKVKGNAASVSMTLFANYEGGVALPAGAPHAESDFSIPDADDFYVYNVRNLLHEEAALKTLKNLGIKATYGTTIEPIAGEREVLNFLGTTVPVLRRTGWKVMLDERLEAYMLTLDYAIPIVKIIPTQSGGKVGAFEIGCTYATASGATNVTPADIQRAISMRESFVKHGDTVTLVDIDAIQSMRDVFTDCASGDSARPGFFRVSNVYAPYVKASLDALDGIDVEQPPAWRDLADNQNRQTQIRDVTLPSHLAGILRPYQKQGVAWFRFLESNRLGGILADEMGLGKTLQTLSWLSLRRIHDEDNGKPALVICPTSLVDNWAHEAKKFTPEMRVLTMSGAQRHENFETLPRHDLVITSYALIRRDIAQYREIDFAAIILDEAQNIKNRATQNALAVKQLRGDSRLVLTGTPIENSVADLWSIMDFLMPGYLGEYEEFRANYELPLSVPDDPMRDAIQRKLRCKLHPFLLRRKKADVAKDLPPKIVKVSWSTLTSDQRRVYDQILSGARSEISGMVAEKGFEKSRMAILSILLRLRQICCHLDLLGDKNPAPDSKEPSAKMEQFFELYDEAVSDGHRILVFSQFVKMLTLLRGELDARGIRYCYLDGASKDRIESVHRFNTDAQIPLFLISLKAGGTGLNLTGADTVVHFDPWWNPAVEDQATDRAHRIGQKSTVYSLKMITSDTVEEKVLDMQQRKRAIIGATVESDEQTMSKLTWDDVKSLLDL